MPDNSQDELKGVLEGLRTGVEGFHTKADAIQKQVDAIEQKMQRPDVGGSSSGPSLAEHLWNAPEFKSLASHGRGKAIVVLPDGLLETERKTLITSTAVGSSVSGVLQIGRIPGVVPEARRQLFIRDLLTTFPTAMGTVDFVRISSHAKVVSPQTEGSAKGESELKFTTTSCPVRTVATWIPCSKQVLEDFGALRATIEGSLLFGLEEEIEDQILSGDNTGLNLNGLVTQAQGYNITLTNAADGWEYGDLIARSIQQLAEDNELQPDFVCLNPADFWHIRLAKNTTGDYVWYPPLAAGPGRLFGLTPIITNAMTKGYFLVGNSSARACAVFERQASTVELSTEHASFWTENKIAIRVEARLAIAVFRPDSFVYGAFTASPA